MAVPVPAREHLPVDPPPPAAAGPGHLSVVPAPPGTSAPVASSGPAGTLGPVSGVDVSPVLTAMREHHPDLPLAAREQVLTAFTLADRAHAGQRRTSGEPYIVHPVAVALTVAELGMDADTVAAALCHDVVEDTPVTLETLQAQIGPAAAFLVDGVTKLDQVADASKADLIAGSLRKLLVAATADVRTLIIKLADRRHNMQTLAALTPAKRSRVAAETLEVYAPLAHRLGMSELKAELEDAAFAELDPDRFASVSALIDAAAPRSAQRLAAAVNSATAALTAAGIDAQVTGRNKHVYSVWKKMSVRAVPFAEIADLLGVRVLVEDVAACYAALGVLHQAFTPVPARFRDYIALPKWGQYRSLHTTLIDASGLMLEVQVRTWQMHAQAEFGAAAHWRYKDDGRGAGTGTGPQLDAGPQVAATGRDEAQVAPALGPLPWLSDLLHAGAAAEDAEEFLSALRRDLDVEEVVALTPDGDLVELPAGATALDFAYHVHTEIGRHAVAARVNGLLAALSSVLAPGDRVEIVTGEQVAVCPDWLKFTVTSRARHAVRAELNAQHRDGVAATALAAVAAAAGRPRLAATDLEPAAAGCGYSSPAALLAAVADGHVAAERVASRLAAADSTAQAGHAGEPGTGLHEENADRPGQSGTGGQDRWAGLDPTLAADALPGVAVLRAACVASSPLHEFVGVPTPGTSGRIGVVVAHAADCPAAAATTAGGLLDVHRVRSAGTVRAELTALDRPGLFARVCTLLFEAGSTISDLQACAENGLARITVTFTVADDRHTGTVLGQLGALAGVTGIRPDTAQHSGATRDA